MEEVTYQGKKYTRTNTKWVDSDHLVVHQSLQAILNGLYLQAKDFSSYSFQELIDEGDKFKKSESFRDAVVFYEKAIPLSDERTIRVILPRITSCYRAMHLPRKAIGLFSDARGRYGTQFLTAPLLTSVAAAYCDVKEYENAYRCIRWAWKFCGGKSSGELQSVFGRIKKESGLGIEFED